VGVGGGNMMHCDVIKKIFKVTIGLQKAPVGKTPNASKWDPVSQFNDEK